MKKGKKKPVAVCCPSHAFVSSLIVVVVVSYGVAEIEGNLKFRFQELLATWPYHAQNFGWSIEYKNESYK